MSWESAVEFDNQKELTCWELFLMNDLIQKGFEVRYDELYIYNRRNDQTISIQRIHLIKLSGV
jgi:hypothetical protein